jgi:signal transduction histidine kinase
MDTITLKISVKDTGIGIPESEMKKLFRKFEKYDDFKNLNEGGSGLGLSLCKRISEKMGGKITVYSKVDKGTTISFYFEA